MSEFSLTNAAFPEVVQSAGSTDPLPVAVVDIGSNSVRLVVYTGAVRAPTPLYNEKVLCGLGKSVASTGHLGAEAIERAVHALVRFRAISRTLKVGFMKAVATAAVREAVDGPEFIERAERAIGMPIEVLTGTQEAELAARGIQMGFHDPDGIAGDLGGGSLELISIRNGRLSNAASLPLGVLRLADMSGANTTVAGKLAKTAIRDLAWLGSEKPERFYAVGGTWRSLVRLHMEQTAYPLRVMHHYTIATDEAVEFCRQIRTTKKLGQLNGIETVSKARRDTLPFGAVALEQVLLAVKPKHLVVSVFGIREGLLYELLRDSERVLDPLICFSEEYARSRSRSPMHGYELFDWVDPIFKALQPGETAEARRLRLAACLLSDIGWRAHPDYRGEQSLNVIAHAALSGIDHPGRLFLALTLFFRHAGAGESGVSVLAPRLREIAGEKALANARILAAAIRAAHMISCGMTGVIDETPVSLRDGTLLLQLPGSYAAYDGERVHRRFQALADLIGHKLKIAVGG